MDAKRITEILHALSNKIDKEKEFLTVLLDLLFVYLLKPLDQHREAPEVNPRPGLRSLIIIPAVLS